MTRIGIRLPFNLAAALAAIVGGVAIAVVLVPPSSLAGHAHAIRMLTVVVAGLVIVAVLPPHLFIGGSVAVLGLSYVIPSRNVGSTTIYAYDVLIVLVVLRALLPRDRRPVEFRLMDTYVAAAAAAWILVMLVAGIRGSLDGNSLGALARLEMGIVYFPFFYWGFTRVMRERGAQLLPIVKTCAVVAVAFIAYAAYARLTHHRFGNHHGSGIGIVPTTDGALRRDYGVFSAFQLYPLLAIGGLAFLIFSTRKNVGALSMTVIGLAATLLTLVRGFIFGVALAAAWMLVVGVRGRWQVRLGWRLAPLLALVALAGVLLFSANPVAGHGLAERVLPGVLRQSNVATHNADVRAHLLSKAVHIASSNPFGLGFVRADTLDSVGFPFESTADNQWATLLMYTGWPGIFTLLWVGIAAVRRSSRLPVEESWLQAFLAGTALLVLVQGFGWDILFTLRWSLGMLGFVVALRAAFAVEAESAPAVEVRRRLGFARPAAAETAAPR